MRMPVALNGLLQTTPLSSREIHDATVIDVRTNVGYSPMRLPQFYLDGSVAISGKEPERLCTEYKVRLKPSRGRARWYPVSQEAFLRAQTLIGQPLGD